MCAGCVRNEFRIIVTEEIMILEACTPPNKTRLWVSASNYVYGLLLCFSVLKLLMKNPFYSHRITHYARTA